jgi:hypothetical protein
MIYCITSTHLSSDIFTNQQQSTAVSKKWLNLVSYAFLGPLEEMPWPKKKIGPGHRMPLVITGTPARSASEVTPRPPWRLAEIS